MAGKNAAIGGGGFHHVAMRATDFDRSFKFYTQALGFRERLRWGEGDGRAVMLDTGDGGLLEIFAGGKGPMPEGVILHFALRTASCDAALERARAAGATVTMEPQDVTIPSIPPAKVRIAFCTGPDGEVIEFFQSSDI
jgi:catechol 2,3-dioxygenase-like lactoylglutathione lyase family enzyme